MAHEIHDDGFHEIQLSGKQLVFLFMATTVVFIVIFLCGILVGRGVQNARGTIAEAAGPEADSAGLADAGCRVWGVEADRTAVDHARRNVPAARFTRGRVEQALRRLPKRTDLIVLDPPRTGAGRAVMAQVADRRPRSIAYVACDPAALARDLAYAATAGYEPASIRAMDLFPMTHHVECVAVLMSA